MASSPAASVERIDGFDNKDKLIRVIRYSVQRLSQREIEMVRIRYVREIASPVDVYKARLLPLKGKPVLFGTADLLAYLEKDK